MKNYYVVCIYDNRVVTKDGKRLVLTGKTPRGAKMRYTRSGRYIDWNSHILVEVVQ